MSDVSYDKAEDFTIGECDGSAVPPALEVPFAEAGGSIKLVPCSRADNFVMNILGRGGSMSGLLGMAIDGDHGPFGIFISIDADMLRNVASAMLACADKLDGGKGKQ